MFEDSLRRVYLFLHVCFILWVWSLMIWILCLFNTLSNFLCKFFRGGACELWWYRLEQKINRRSNSLIWWDRCFGIMTVFIIGCENTDVMYFVCWRVFALVRLFSAICHVSFSKSVCQYSFVLCLNLRFSTRWRLVLSTICVISWWIVIWRRDNFSFFSSCFDCHWSFSFFRDHSRICSKYFVIRRRSNHCFFSQIQRNFFWWDLSIKNSSYDGTRSWDECSSWFLNFWCFVYVFKKD